MASNTLNTSNQLPTQTDFFHSGAIRISAWPGNCNICAEPLETEVIKLIACRHMFHLECAIAWFESDNARRGSCPNCRCELFEPAPLTQAQIDALDEEMMDPDDQEADDDERYELSDLDEQEPYVDEPYGPHYDPPMSEFIDDSDAPPVPRRVRRRRTNTEPVAEPVDQHPVQPPPRAMLDPRPWRVLYDTQAFRDETDAGVAGLLASAKELNQTEALWRATHTRRFDVLRNDADESVDNEVVPISAGSRRGSQDGPQAREGKGERVESNSDEDAIKCLYDDIEEPWQLLPPQGDSSAHSEVYEDLDQS
ncbi:hypothetical protein HBI08_136740 [Parastagonospora nodorum]|nr:hypothetical protein HBI08_136740 [Parastagonospora nodorum]